jgi:hypothetical protein
LASWGAKLLLFPALGHELVDPIRLHRLDTGGAPNGAEINIAIEIPRTIKGIGLLLPCAKGLPNDLITGFYAFELKGLCLACFYVDKFRLGVWSSSPPFLSFNTLLISRHMLAE